MNSINLATLTEMIEAEMRDILQLPNGAHVNVKFTANGALPEAGGEINIKFSLPSTKMTGAQTQQKDDEVLFLGTLRDCYEKMKRPFISLSWFRDKYLPSLGVHIPQEEMEPLILRLISRGQVVIDKVDDKRTGRQVAAIRTPDMPAAHDTRVKL